MNDYSQQNNNQRPAGRSTNPFVYILATIGVFTLLAFIAMVVLLVTAIQSVPHITFGGGRGGEDLEFIRNMKNEKYIAGIKLDTEINSETADVVLKKLEEARKSQGAVGILLEVSSPGGAVVPSQELYDLVKQINEKKPVVAYVRDMAASGAYYASASAKQIVANRTSLIGSVGVILSSFEATQAIQFLKLKPVTLKTGKLKDSGSPMREWTAEDKAYLQKLIEDTRHQFVEDIVAARKLSPEVVSYMSDGRVVLGAEAVGLNLVDKIGNKQDALNSIADFAGLPEAPKLIYLEDRKDMRLLINELLQESRSFVSHLQNISGRQEKMELK